MAGDWIKMRRNLDTHPKVIELSSVLEIPTLHVVGMLWKVWSWADSHSLDGNALRVTDVTLDRFVDCVGFAVALRKVEWLTGRDNALSFPRFADHNGQTAKTRAETKKRVSRHRNAKCVTDVTQSALPEKRREEKSNEKEKTTDQLICVFDFTPEFSKVWDVWKRHRIEKQKPVGSVEEEQQLYQLSRFAMEEAVKIVRYSIASGAINLITNGDHKARPPRVIPIVTKSKELITLETLS